MIEKRKYSNYFELNNTKRERELSRSRLNRFVRIFNSGSTATTSPMTLRAIEEERDELLRDNIRHQELIILDNQAIKVFRTKPDSINWDLNDKIVIIKRELYRNVYLDLGLIKENGEKFWNKTEKLLETETDEGQVKESLGDLRKEINAKVLESDHPNIIGRKNKALEKLAELTPFVGSGSLSFKIKTSTRNAKTVGGDVKIELEPDSLLLDFNLEHKKDTTHIELNLSDLSAISFYNQIAYNKAKVVVVVVVVVDVKKIQWDGSNTYQINYDNIDFDKSQVQTTLKPEDKESPIVGVIELQFSSIKEFDPSGEQYIQLNLSKVDFIGLERPDVFTKEAKHLVLNYFDPSKEIKDSEFIGRFMRDGNKLKGQEDKNVVINILKPLDADYDKETKTISLKWTAFREIEVKSTVPSSKSYIEFKIDDIIFEDKTYPRNDDSSRTITFIFNTYVTPMVGTSRKKPIIKNLSEEEFNVNEAERLTIDLYHYSVPIDTYWKLRYDNLKEQLEGIATTDHLRVYIINSIGVSYDEDDKSIEIDYENLGLISGGTIGSLLTREILELEESISERLNKEPYRTWFGGGNIELDYNELLFDNDYLQFGGNWEQYLSYINEVGDSKDTSFDNIKDHLLGGLCEYAYPRLIQSCQDGIITKEQITDYLNKYNQPIEKAYWSGGEMKIKDKDGNDVNPKEIFDNELK